MMENNRINEFFDSKLCNKNSIVLKVIEFEEIIHIENPNSILNKEFVILSELIRKYNYSIEPDIQYQNIKLKSTDSVVVFREDFNPTRLSSEYKHASLLIKLGCLIASYDGVVDKKEVDELFRYINKNIILPSYEIYRLRAFLERMLSTHLNFKMFLVKLRELNDFKKNEVIKIAKEMIVIDGFIDEREVSLLNHIYELFSDIQDLPIEKKNTKRDLKKYAKEHNINLNNNISQDDRNALPSYMLKDDSLIDELLDDFGY